MIDLLEDENLLIKPTNPYTISLSNNNYEQSDIKIMVFGQETNSWFGDFNNDLNSCLNNYENFDSKAYGKSFWNTFHEIKREMENRNKNKTIGIIANNLIKVGSSERYKNTPPNYIRSVESNHFNVIKREIEILTPDIIIFLTGPYYDQYIQQIFEEIHFKSLDDRIPVRKLARIAIDNHENIYRTYYPTYLNRSKLRPEYLNKIFESIEFNGI